MAKQKISANTWPVKKTISDPGAGNNVSITVPADEVWEFVSANFLFTPDGAGVTRNVRLISTDSVGVEISSSDFTGDIGISTATDIEVSRFAVAPATVAGVDYIESPINLIIPPLGKIQTQIPTLESGDLFTAAFMYVKVFKASQ
jgi:hypothetical protein